MNGKIIDFHTHPFGRSITNICSHKDIITMNTETTVDVFRRLGIGKICGSVIGHFDAENKWAKARTNKDEALALWEELGDFYVPGFHVHPEHVEESIEEIHRMAAKGVRLIGELVPYFDDWKMTYAAPEFWEIIQEAAKFDMVVSIHSQDEDAMDELVKNNKNVKIVAAHPGEYEELVRHLERAKLSDNYFVDLSGYGIFRYGALRHLVDVFGEDRVIFGSDYPTCNPCMYLGGVVDDELLTDREKEKILYLNAKRILNL